MELYFAPMACSLATRISLYEAGAAAARFIEVDTHTKRLAADGADYWALNPMGQVPALRTDDGRLLTENAAVLQHVGEAFPAAGLLPADAAGRDAVRQWIGFIGTELHKAVFVPRLDPKAPAEVKAYAGEMAALRLSVLERHLSEHEHLVGGFSIADAYLATILNWAPFAAVDLKPYPALHAYHRRIAQRPAVARAIGEEFELYKQEQARRKAA